MPKKSRREKMLADIRRRVRTEHVVTAQTPAAPIREQSATFRFSQPANHTKQDPIPTDTSELIAIKKDLTKTVIFATLAIAAELVLFWFERR